MYHYKVLTRWITVIWIVLILVVCVCVCVCVCVSFFYIFCLTHWCHWGPLYTHTSRPQNPCISRWREKCTKWKNCCSASWETLSYKDMWSLIVFKCFDSKKNKTGKVKWNDLYLKLLQRCFPKAVWHTKMGRRLFLSGFLAMWALEGVQLLLRMPSVPKSSMSLSPSPTCNHV